MHPDEATGAFIIPESPGPARTANAGKCALVSMSAAPKIASGRGSGRNDSESRLEKTPGAGIVPGKFPVEQSGPGASHDSSAEG